jgi:farnesyl-diphosphate farnesyltransferase
MPYRQDELLTRLLKDVSRSFYLTLSILPAAVRPQIGLAYLLARTSDTIADTAIVPVEKRLEALAFFRERIAGTNRTLLDFGGFVAQQGTPAERVLLEKCESSLALLEQLGPEDLELVRVVLHVITSGQELDLRRFADSSPTRIVALATDAELDDYTYRVAGCVGEFWTRLCLAHLYRSAGLPAEELIRDGIRFGKGLQLVNILRDMPADLQQGRCYLPSETLSVAGLTPESLLEPSKAVQFRLLFQQYLDHATDHLQAGWQYTNTLPWYSVRVRLACTWPILIGLETIRLLRRSENIAPGQRIKVGRDEVKKIIRRSVIAYCWPPSWKRLVDHR